MKLVIVESPAKCKILQKYLGNEYKVMASFGHICDLAKGGNYGLGIDIENNFKPHYMLMADKINVLNEIIDAASKSEMILLASDLDTEGEAIAAHLARYLASTNKPIKRIRFGEITKTAILKSVQDLQDINIGLVKAQEGRRILDRLVGFLVSPLIQNHYNLNSLSAGRVQSVVVRMIMEREREISVFNPEEFWNIYAKFITGNKDEISTKFNLKSKNAVSTQAIVSAIKDQKEFYVSKIISQKKKEKPCLPLITASLQQYMAKKYSFEPDQTMKMAQNLYENGLCSYIRTDSVRTSPEAISSVREFIKGKFDLPTKPNIYEVKAESQNAHECIRPTNVNTLPDSFILTGKEKLVYTAIWQHFVASQMNPAIWDTMQVIISARNNDKLSFGISGKALIYKGYLEILGNVDISKIEIPTLNEQDILILKPDSIKTEQKFTQPPSRYTDASIIKELEVKQIGRPSTYAEIIKKISARNYVEKQGSSYHPTKLGTDITKILIDAFPFMEYKYSSNLEKKLDDIENGKTDQLSMLNDFFGPFKIQLNKAYMNDGSGLCEKCGNPTVIRTNSKNQMKFTACIWPNCRKTKAIAA